MEICEFRSGNHVGVIVDVGVVFRVVSLGWASERASVGVIQTCQVLQLREAEEEEEEETAMTNGQQAKASPSERKD